MNETKIIKQKVLETVNICSNEERSNPASQEKEMVKIVGTTTSQIQQALKGSKTHGQYPYPARVFLRLDCVVCHNTKQLCQALTPKHRKCEECAKQKCRECEIPVFFRIKEKDN